jgi:septum formation protein
VTPDGNRLILASASPRRREMLAALGVEFEAVVPEVDEVREGPPPEVLVLENALRKARAGLELAGAGERSVALGIDTEVVLEGRTLGKAESEAQARERLALLSGRTHEVMSGLAVVGAEGDERTGLARSLVTFRRLDRDTIDRYLASGEWRDRAGAYAIQGLGSLLVARLEGDFSNVVGLPLQVLFSVAPELLENPPPKVQG